MFTKIADNKTFYTAVSYDMRKKIDILIGKNIKRLRLREHFSQERLAIYLKIESVGLVSDWERGVKGVGKDILEKLCKILKAKPYEFYIDNETPILIDKEEKELLITYREAKELGLIVAEKIPQYGRFVVNEVKTMKERAGLKQRKAG